jgi:hypothetical protein
LNWPVLSRNCFAINGDLYVLKEKFQIGYWSEQGAKTLWVCKFEWKKRNQCFYDKCSVQIKLLKTEFLEYEWLK